MKTNLNNFLKNKDEKYVRSLLKWPGGKFKLLNVILEHTKCSDDNTFYDVFGGSGVVSINSNNKNIVYNDINKDLCDLFKFIKSKTFIENLEKAYQNPSKQKYNENRKEFNNLKSGVEKSALFLYLNKCGFNGLCRYNSSGKYNVPAGDKLETKKLPIDSIDSTKERFVNKKIKVTNLSFEDVVKLAVPGDSFYFDPPYLKSDEFKTSFTNYSSDGFNINQHLNLVELAIGLRKIGCFVVISNSDTAETRELYKDATKIIEIDVRRSISKEKEGRKLVKELLVIY